MLTCLFTTIAFTMLSHTLRSSKLAATIVGRSRLGFGGRISGSRAFSNVDFDDEFDSWPITKPNTIVNICPQGNLMIVERFGKLHSIEQAGVFFAIPLVDSISYVVDMREKAIAITPQAGITKDNVHVSVSGNLYCQFTDAEKAAYGSKNPVYSVKQLAQSTMRAAIGEMELDEILHSRAHLNSIIKRNVEDASRKWGIEIQRYEITEVSPDKFITEAMDKQAAAERDRRKKVLEAEGDKQAAQLASEGFKIRLKNESEGQLVKVTNEAEGKKRQLILECEGEAAAIKLRAEAQAKAIETIAKSLSTTEAQQAAQLAVAREYITMYGDIGSKSNTMIFSDKPGDLNALMAQASSIVKATTATSVADANFITPTLTPIKATIKS